MEIACKIAKLKRKDWGDMSIRGALFQ